MSLKFTKMHGLGNDFMVIDGIHQSVHLSTEEIKKLSRRDTGIGFDQCLLVEPSHTPGIDFSYRIFNADGHEVGQCGNGARCLARFLQHYNLTDKKEITVATPTTQMTLVLNADQSVTVDMGIPLFEPQDIPIKASEKSECYTIPLQEGKNISVHAINVGNPHAVILVPNIDSAPIKTIGAEISTHPLFPEQVNVGFMEIINPGHMKLRVYERGCGETQACGSGAVAAAAIGRLFHHMDKQIEVHLPGGKLIINWSDITAAIHLTGPATFVYEGRLMEV